MSSKFSALALEVEKPTCMNIMHPVSRQPLRDKDGKTAYINLYSGDSEIARRHQRSVQRRRLNMVRGRSKLTPEELEAEAVEFLAAVTAPDWYLVDFDGNVIDVPFSPENARELYKEPALLWLREQVDEWVADRGNFSTALSNNSATTQNTNSDRAKS